MFVEVAWNEFYDFQKIHTPVNVKVYEKLLKRYKYDKEETAYLVKGLKQGFSIEYKGPRNRTVQARNLKLRAGTKTQLWNKVMKEVKEQRTAGPYSWENLPIKNPHQSPLGLVPKQKAGGVKVANVSTGIDQEEGQDVWLIFHLSHPAGESVNDYISEEKSHVKYSQSDKRFR